MSQLKTTSLSHKDNNTGTPNITMYPDGTTSLNYAATGFKNQLINPNIVVRQRVMAGNSGFVCDRWFVDHPADTANDGPPGLERVIFASGSTNCQVRQAIELDNPNKQNQFAPGTTWTASVWARSPAGVPSFSFTYRKGLQDATGEIQVFNPVWQLMSPTGETAGSSANASNIYTRYSYSFTMPDLQSSISSNSLICVVANFRFEGDYRATGFQLEPGPTVSDFEFRFIGTELSLCQRYYYTFSTGWFAPYWHGFDNSCYRGGMSFILPTEMRIPPNKTLSGLNWVSDGGVNLIETYGGTPQLSVTTSRITAYLRTTSQPAAGVQGQCQFNADLDAEL